jgi:hypothetical protein
MKLTKRQVEIVQALADDCDIKDVAISLGIAYSTVKNLMGRMRPCVGKFTTWGLVAYCFRKGLVK